MSTPYLFALFHMAKEFAKHFYASVAWKNLRTSYRKKCGGLCEQCIKDGTIKAGDIVHHIIAITPGNIHDTNITLNENNLMYVCRECHERIHEEQKREALKLSLKNRRGKKSRRWRVDSTGKVSPL